MSNIYTWHDRTNGAIRALALPALPLVGDKKIEAALERFIGYETKRQQAVREWQLADADVVAVENAERADLGEAFFADPDADLPDPLGRTRAAKNRAEDAQAIARALTDTVGRSYAELIALIEKRAGTWRDSMAQRAEAAVLKLATATRRVEEAQVELDTALGVMEMFAANAAAAEAGGSVTMTMRQSQHELHLSEAVTGLHTAIGKASARSKEL